MSNENTTGHQNPWQSQNQQPYPTQPVETSRPGGAYPVQAPLGQQFDQQAQHQAPAQGQQGVMPYAQQGQMQHQAMGNGVMNRGPLGKVRNTWGCFGLSLITLGIYQLVWIYKIFSEMKAHRGAGTGGGVALLIEIIFPPATFFMAPSEVSHLYTGAGRPSPVSGATGLWMFLPILGPIIWFFQVNGALNDYWTSMSAGQAAPQQQLPAGA